MSDTGIRLLALILVAIWLAVGLLAYRGHRGAAVALNVLIAAVMCAFTLPPLVSVLVDAEGYIRDHGRAALRDLRSGLVLAVLSLLSIVASLLSRRRGARLFVIGWLLNAPSLAFTTMVAFFLRLQW